MTEILDQNSEGYLIGIHCEFHKEAFRTLPRLSMELYALACETWPPENTYATMIVARMLRHALTARGIKVLKCVAVGYLTDSIFLLRVDELKPGLRVVKEELEAILLLNETETVFGWRDDDEMIWREAWPLPAPRLLGDVISDERIASLSRWAAEMTTRSEQALREMIVRAKRQGGDGEHSGA